MTLQHQGLLILLDGLGDNPCEALGGRTPLEAARTPHLDRLVEDGLCGLVDPLAPGIPVGTHTGIALLLGTPRDEVLRMRRGPIEAAGIGLETATGDVLLRCNFATLKPVRNHFEIVDRRAMRIHQGMEALAEVLQEVPLPHGIFGTLRPATQHRAVLRLHDGDLSDQVTDTDSGDRFRRLGVRWSQPLDPRDVAARHTADAINAFVRIAFERLQEHPVNRERRRRGLLPANGIITRGAGKHSPLQSLIRHVGLSAAVVSGERTVIGLARLLDYDTQNGPGFTALPDTDLEGKLAATERALDEHAIAVLHIKGTDICAHDHEPGHKRDFIERIDRILAPLLERRDLVVGVTGDHTTDSTSGTHTGDPVPALLYRPGGRRDGATRFGEASCLGGGLGRIDATGFIASLLDAMGALPNHHPSHNGFYSLTPP